MDWKAKRPSFKELLQHPSLQKVGKHKDKTMAVHSHKLAPLYKQPLGRHTHWVSSDTIPSSLYLQSVRGQDALEQHLASSSFFPFQKEKEKSLPKSLEISNPWATPSKLSCSYNHKNNVAHHHLEKQTFKVTRNYPPHSPKTMEKKGIPTQTIKRPLYTHTSNALITKIGQRSHWRQLLTPLTHSKGEDEWVSNMDTEKGLHSSALEEDTLAFFGMRIPLTVLFQSSTFQHIWHASEMFFERNSSSLSLTGVASDVVSDLLDYLYFSLNSTHQDGKKDTGDTATFVPCLENCIELLELAVYLNLPQLTEICIDKIADNFQEVNEFGDLPTPLVQHILRKLDTPSLMLAEKVLRKYRWQKEIDLCSIWGAVFTRQGQENAFQWSEFDGKEFWQLPSNYDRIMEEMRRQCIETVIIRLLSSSSLAKEDMVTLLEWIHDYGDAVRTIQVDDSYLLLDPNLSLLIKLTHLSSLKFSPKRVSNFEPWQSYLNQTWSKVHLEFKGCQFIDQGFETLLQAITLQNAPQLKRPSHGGKSIKVRIQLEDNLTLENGTSTIGLTTLLEKKNGNLRDKNETLHNQRVMPVLHLLWEEDPAVSQNCMLMAYLRQPNCYLVSLSLKHSYLDKKQIKQLSLGLRNPESLGGLESLDVSYCQLEEEGVVLLCSALGGHTLIRHLSLAGNMKQPEKDIAGKEVASMLHRTPRLCSLNVADNLFSTVDHLAILRALSDNKPLKCVDLSGTDLGTAIEHFVQHLSQPNQGASLSLSQLSLASNRISPRNLVSFIKNGLHHLKHLSTLNLNHMGLPMEVVRILSEWLHSSKAIITLEIAGQSHLHHHFLGNEGFMYLLENGVWAHRTLQRLNVAGQNISHVDVAYLGTLVSHSSMTLLNLEGNPLHAQIKKPVRNLTGSLNGLQQRVVILL